MTINGRTVELKENFTIQLATIQEYISQHDPKKARLLTTKIANYVLDVIAPNPHIFAEYSIRPTPERMYRRAIYRRKYIIIYKVTDERVTFPAIYHASQNYSSTDLDE